MNSEQWFREVRISLLQFWALPNNEKLRVLPPKNHRVRYFASGCVGYTTDPLKHLALQSTMRLDFVIEGRGGTLEGASKELSFLLGEMLSHKEEVVWRIDRGSLSVEEDTYWLIIERLARISLEALRVKRPHTLRFEDFLDERSRRSFLRVNKS